MNTSVLKTTVSMLSKNRVSFLLSTSALLNVAEWAFMTALAVYAYDLDGALGVGLIGLRFPVTALSAATLAPLVEHRRGVVGATLATRVLMFGVGSLLAIGGYGLLPLLAAVIVDAFLGACYLPAQRRLIPTLAKTPQGMTQAVARFSTVKTVGQAVGATASALALTSISPGAAMAVATGLMALAFLPATALANVKTSHLIDGASSLTEGFEAIPEVFHDRMVRPLVMAGVLRTMSRGGWEALAVVIALKMFDVGDSGVGLFRAAVAVGAILSVPIAATQIGRSRLAPAWAIGFVCTGLAISVVGLAPPFAVAVAAIAAWGTAMSVSDGVSMSLMHRMLDPRTRFRTEGVKDSLEAVAEGAGALLVPATIALFGVRGAILFVAVPLPLLVIFTWSSVSATDRRAEGRGRLVSLLHKVSLLRGLDLASIEDLASRLKPVTAEAGTKLVTQGEPGDSFYVIQSGRAEVLIDSYPVGELAEGRWFGERALLREGLRTATVQALEPITCQSLDRGSFLEALTGMEVCDQSSLALAAEKRDVSEIPVVELLEALSQFESVSGDKLEHLAATSSRTNFAEGEPVVTIGDPSDAMYVILSGKAVAEADGEGVDTPLHPGDAFGDIGVLHNTPRTRTVRATTPLRVLVLPGKAVLEAAGRRSRHTEESPAAVAVAHEARAEPEPEIAG